MLIKAISYRNGGNDYVLEKQSKKISIIIIVIVTLFIFVYFLATKGYSRYREYKAEKSRENVVKMVKDNRDILDVLVKKMYSQKVRIFVTYENEKIQFMENDQNKKIDQGFENVLLSIFSNLNCERITLYNEPSYGGKVIKILLGTNMDREGDDLLLYCENKNTKLEDEIFPNWYYRTLFHE